MRLISPWLHQEMQSLNLPRNSLLMFPSHPRERSVSVIEHACLFFLTVIKYLFIPHLPSCIRLKKLSCNGRRWSCCKNMPAMIYRQIQRRLRNCLGLNQSEISKTLWKHFSSSVSSGYNSSFNKRLTMTLFRSWISVSVHPLFIVNIHYMDM